jgi:hypothetical protein
VLGEAQVHRLIWQRSSSAGAGNATACGFPSMTLAPPARVASIPLRCSIAASSSSSDMDLTPLRASSAHQPVRASRSWCACSRPSLRLWMLGLRVKMLSCRVLKPFAVFSSRRSQYRSQSSREPNRRLSTWQLDRLLDPSAPDEERQSRKRRLLKGPKEFRDMRDGVRSRSKS